MGNFFSRYWKWLVGGLVALLVVSTFLRSSAGSSEEWVSVEQAHLGSLDVLVNADGSVSSDQSVELMPKTSGTVEGIGVEEGDKVVAGQFLL